MSKRLSKISRELNIGISVIADFLNKNGYQCEEEPSEKISEEVAEFVYSNIKSFLSNSDGGVNVLKIEQHTSDKIDKTPIPLELKIVDAASKHKKLTERIIGFSDFDWSYNVAKFKGVCSQPVDFNLFDEAICAILLKGETSLKRIGDILGFDIETDPAEKEILRLAILDLKKDEIVDGDESVYWLTNMGRDYAKNGVKFSTFERDFELYIDAIGNLKENAKEIFSKLKSEKKNTFFECTNLPKTIDDVKPLAEIQAPEIHFPTKRFILQSCQSNGIEGYMAKVWIILLENFRNNTIRALVYDEKQDSIIDSLSESFDILEDEKNKLLEKLVKQSEKDDFTVESTIEQKRESQILSEQKLIEKQEEIETALENKDYERITSIQKEIVNIKRHFNSLEFEVELKRLFEETADELWIISPWIKKYATLRRIPFFENYLRKGGRIFIAYSLPENNTDVMADEEAMEKLLELEHKYHNFYIHQLPAFHYKRVWLRTNGAKDLYYSGSYNILSFFVKQGLQNYRQEEMSRFDWNSENDEEYERIIIQFGEKYLKKAVDELNELCKSKDVIDKSSIQKIKGANYGKLKVFLNRGYDAFDKQYEEIERTKEENLANFKMIYYTNKLAELRNDITSVKNQTLSIERKKAFQSQLSILQNEYPELSKVEEYVDVVNIINSIKVFTAANFKSNNKKQFNKKKRK